MRTKAAIMEDAQASQYSDRLRIELLADIRNVLIAILSTLPMGEYEHGEQCRSRLRDYFMAAGFLADPSYKEDPYD